MKKRLLVLALTLAMILTLAACSSGGSESAAGSTGGDSTPASDTTASSVSTGDTGDQNDWVKLNLSYASHLTENNPYQQNIAYLQDELNELMPGLITITSYYNGTLLAPPDVFDGILQGSCDIGYVQIDYLPNRLPICQMFGYPGIVYNGSSVATQVFQDFVKEWQPAELSDVVFLLGQCSGPCCFFTTTPVDSLDDLKGMQLRAGSTLAKTVEAYGAVPVTLDISECYEAMRNSLINGVYTMYGACAYANLEEVGKYALIDPLSNNPYMLAMNKEVFNSMPASQQEAFMEAVDDTFQNVTTSYQEDGLMVDRVIEFASKVHTSFLEGDMLQQFQAASSHIMSDYVKQMDDQGLDGTGALALVEKLADKYNSQFTLDDYIACYPPLNLEG